MSDKDQFIALTEKLVHGLLREAIGYRVEYQIPYFQGIVGYMVDAPMLWIRHSRFPILFIAYDQRRPDLLNNVVKQLEISRATEFFALLIAVPAHERRGNEAEELRNMVAHSVYRYDFVVLDRHHLAGLIALGSSQRLIEIILEQGVELSSLSPYIVKGPVPDKMFFGREKEIKAIMQSLPSGDHAIVGGRRIGKSSVLLRIHRLLNNDPRYRAIYLNCEEKFDYGDLFRVLGDQVGEPLDSADPLAFRKFATILKRQTSNQQVILLLDEVDELLGFDARSQPAGQLFKTFRAVSHEGICRFVFSGSRTFYRHLHNPQSPFFNFCEHIVLRPLEERSVAEIVTKPMRQLGIELPEEEALIDRIIDLTSSHPNVAQWFCDRLIKTISLRRITLNDLEKISVHPEFYHHYVTTAWGAALPLDKLISLLMEGPSFQVNQLFEVLSRYRITDKIRIRESLDMLQLNSLLDCQEQHYRFCLSHFPRMARQIEDVSSQITSLLSQIEV